MYLYIRIAAKRILFEHKMQKGAFFSKPTELGIVPKKCKGSMLALNVVVFEWYQLYPVSFWKHSVPGDRYGYSNKRTSQKNSVPEKK